MAAVQIRINLRLLGVAFLLLSLAGSAKEVGHELLLTGIGLGSSLSDDFKVLSRSGPHRQYEVGKRADYVVLSFRDKSHRGQVRWGQFGFEKNNVVTSVTFYRDWELFIDGSVSVKFGDRKADVLQRLQRLKFQELNANEMGGVVLRARTGEVKLSISWDVLTNASAETIEMWK